jgi:hypothetical protein
MLFCIRLLNNEKMSVSDDFKNLIRMYVELDDQIREARAAMTIIQQKKLLFEQRIMQYMEMNGLHDKAIKLNNGKIRYATARSTAPITKQYVYERMIQYFQNPQQANDLLTLIFENRESTERKCIRRTVDKKSIQQVFEQ